MQARESFPNCVCLYGYRIVGNRKIFIIKIVTRRMKKIIPFESLFVSFRYLNPLPRYGGFEV